MDSKIAAYIKMPASDFRQFKKEYKNLFWWLGFLLCLPMETGSSTIISFWTARS